SVRTERGPRQNVVAWLGAQDEAGRLGVLQAARCIDRDPASNVDSTKFSQQSLFEFEDTPVEPRWVRVNTNTVRVENSRSFGGPWLALQLIEQLKLDEFLNKQLPKGKEHIQWSIKGIVEMMEKRYGKSNRIWVMDRGMTSEDNLEFPRQENRRYIIGTNKALLKKFEQELLKKDWTTIRDGIEVKLCKMPKEEDAESTDEVTETFILCRSQDPMGRCSSSNRYRRRNTQSMR
ncbi:MAG TPA: hypothetical protein VM260_14030, partial [Pirellula sp.]|nr:hypothetical protein [Pirellula sp.]